MQGLGTHDDNFNDNVRLFGLSYATYLSVQDVSQ